MFSGYKPLKREWGSCKQKLKGRVCWWCWLQPHVQEVDETRTLSFHLGFGLESKGRVNHMTLCNLQIQPPARWCYLLSPRENNKVREGRGICPSHTAGKVTRWSLQPPENKTVPFPWYSAVPWGKWPFEVSAWINNTIIIYFYTSSWADSHPGQWWKVVFPRRG